MSAANTDASELFSVQSPNSGVGWYQTPDNHAQPCILCIIVKSLYWPTLNKGINFLINFK